MYRKALLMVAVALLPIPVLAGSVEGTHVIWMNLSARPAPVDTAIKTLLDEHPPTCWDDYSLLFMRHRPPAITPQLVRAVMAHQPGATTRLNHVLQQPFEDARNAFDGIIIYEDTPTPMLSSLTTGHKRLRRAPLMNPQALAETLCAVMPQVVRQP